MTDKTSCFPYVQFLSSFIWSIVSLHREKAVNIYVPKGRYIKGWSDLMETSMGCKLFVERHKKGGLLELDD